MKDSYQPMNREYPKLKDGQEKIKLDIYLEKYMEFWEHNCYSLHSLLLPYLSSGVRDFMFT